MLTLDFYSDKGDKWRWRLTGASGEIIGASSQGFASRRLARRNASLLCTSLRAKLR